MITAIPNSKFKWDYTIMDGSIPVAQIDISAWRESGVLTVKNAKFRVYRQGAFSGPFVLESAGSVIAHAEKPSAFRRTMLLTCQGKKYTLLPRGALQRTFDLLDGEQAVGCLSPQSFFSWKMNVALPDKLPLPVQAFAIWLTLLLWKRDAEAA